MNNRKVLLRFLVAGDLAFNPIPNNEILKMLLFLEQTLNLSRQDAYEDFPEAFFEQLSRGQKHRFHLCLDRIDSVKKYRLFEAFHEIYDFIQNDRIDNDEPFSSAEMNALKHLHDRLKQAIPADDHVTTY